MENLYGILKYNGRQGHPDHGSNQRHRRGDGAQPGAHGRHHRDRRSQPGTHRAGRTSTTITYDPADINEANLKAYDAVFLASTTGQFLDDPNDTGFGHLECVIVPPRS